MRSLFLDATLPELTLALLAGPEVVWQVTDAEPRTSDRLHDHLHAGLQYLGWQVQGSKHGPEYGLDAICLTRGPGSFTGARVGIITALGLQTPCAKGAMLPTPAVWACTTLQALFWSLGQPAATIAIDSLGQEVFWQAFAAGKAQGEPQLWQPGAATPPGEIYGNGCAKLAVPVRPICLNPAQIVAQIMVQGGGQLGAQDSPLPLQPLYLKPLQYHTHQNIPIAADA